MKCYKITEKTGNVVGIKAVSEDEEIMIINTEGIIIRMFCNGISVLGRITSGVKLINLKDGDKVASIAKVRDEEKEEQKRKEYLDAEGEDDGSEEESDADIDLDADENFFDDEIEEEAEADEDGFELEIIDLDDEDDE